eukprot:COSAG06_NODE_16547_length_976_cov_0.793527_1_plen_93_part_10
MTVGTVGDAGSDWQNDDTVTKNYPPVQVQGRDNPEFNAVDKTATLDYGMVVTIAGVYNLRLTVSTGDLGDLWRVQVNPASLDISRTNQPLGTF